MGAATVSAPQTINPKPQPIKTYKIGDAGPAGGIVFYDKGEFSEGWRYLEAAPASMEFYAQWGTSGILVGGTGTAVGTGKLNTQFIIDALKRTGESGRAAQLCAALDINGFKDWFLPSRDEHELMYQNLYLKGLGNFRINWYWSSSETNATGAWSHGTAEDGLWHNTTKTSTLVHVRAIRAF